jgi:hypothetical protein
MKEELVSDGVFFLMGKERLMNGLLFEERNLWRERGREKKSYLYKVGD